MELMNMGEIIAIGFGSEEDMTNSEAIIEWFNTKGYIYDEDGTMHSEAGMFHCAVFEKGNYMLFKEKDMPFPEIVAQFIFDCLIDENTIVSLGFEKYSEDGFHDIRTESEYTLKRFKKAFDEVE